MKDGLSACVSLSNTVHRNSARLCVVWCGASACVFVMCLRLRGAVLRARRWGTGDVSKIFRGFHGLPLLIALAEVQTASVTSQLLVDSYDRSHLTSQPLMPSPPSTKTAFYV